MSTLEEICSWQHVRDYGWEGAECEQCKSTSNIISAGLGYKCEDCGAYNCQSIVWCGPSPHRQPDYGPTAEEIRKAVRRVK